MLRYDIKMHQKDQPMHIGTIVVLSPSYLGTSLHTRSPGPQLTSCNGHTNICIYVMSTKQNHCNYLYDKCIVMILSGSTILRIHSPSCLFSTWVLVYTVFSFFVFKFANEKRITNSFLVFRFQICERKTNSFFVFRFQ